MLDFCSRGGLREGNRNLGVSILAQSLHFYAQAAYFSVDAFLAESDFFFEGGSGRAPWKNMARGLHSYAQGAYFRVGAFPGGLWEGTHGKIPN